MKSALFLFLSLIGAAPSAEANFGFAPSPGRTCLVAPDTAYAHGSGEVPFYWTYKDTLHSKNDLAWRLVQRDPRFKARYEEADRRRVDVTKPVGPAAEPKVALPERLRAQEESCLATWNRYWKYITQTSPESDPAASGEYQFSTEAAAKGIFSVEDNGTGFYITASGWFITNYHVAKFLCQIPQTGDRHAAVFCDKGYTLHSYPAWKDYVGGSDYVLMRRGSGRGVTPLKLRTDRPRVLERVFSAGFPERIYDDKTFSVFSAQVIYPVGNSGKSGAFGFMRWDPLVFSTGRLTAIIDTEAVFPGSTPRQLSLSTEGSYLPREQRHAFELHEWDQDLELSKTNVSSGPGSSGSPLMDKQGRVIGILHRDNMFYSTLLMISVLDLCNIEKSESPERDALGRELQGQGLCPAQPQAAAR